VPSRDPARRSAAAGQRSAGSLTLVLLLLVAPARVEGQTNSAATAVDVEALLAASRAAAGELDFVSALAHLDAGLVDGGPELARLELERARLLSSCGDYLGCLRSAQRAGALQGLSTAEKLEAAWWGSNASLWIGRAPLARAAVDRLGELLAAAQAQITSDSAAAPAEALDLAPWIASHANYRQQVTDLEAGQSAALKSRSQSKRLVGLAGGLAGLAVLLLALGFPRALKT
jgi:hypothetical protein